MYIEGMEKEIQLQKIKELLFSKDEASVELGLQLMKALKIMENFPAQFRGNDIITGANYIRGVGVDSENFLGNFLQSLENFFHDLAEEARTKRKIFNVVVELFQHFCSVQNKIPKIVLQVLYEHKQCAVHSETIYNEREIQAITSFLDILNSKNKQEIKEYYQTRVCGGSLNFYLSHDKKLHWVDLRRKNFPNPIQYSIQPFDENYSIFKVMVTAGIKKTRVK